jgi:4-hydroxy-tetrahydrodipicolinate reductase
MPALAIFGVTGRMGQSLIRSIREAAAARESSAGRERPGFTLSGAIASPGSLRLGQDAVAEGPPCGVLITADSHRGLRGAAVALDFSSGAGVAEHAQACAAAGVPVLIGATGFDAASRALLKEAAGRIPVLIAPNTSVAVGVMTELAALAALRLGPSYDVEIHEAHHRTKRDAPSGTALALGEAIARARTVPLSDVAAFDRSSQKVPRVPGSIGFSSLRAGDIVGEHTVTFAAAGERLEITHRATDRMTFARGALRAAEWLVGRPAGLYGMDDVLGCD